MKKYVLAILVMVYCVHFCTAQATDSVQLSVFNTGAKYRLTLATFGAPTRGAELLTEMVLIQDTVVSFVETGSNRASFMPPTLLAKMSDSLRRAFQSQKLMRPIITHRCDKPITADVKDKVVVMELGTCDPSIMCLNAQNAGAKAIVMIHTSNNADSIVLKKGPGREDLKIRCYSVTRDVGARLAAMLPSHVAIKKRVLTPNQGLIARTNTDSTSSSSAIKDPTKLGDSNDNSEGNANGNTEGSTQKVNNAPTIANGLSVTKAQFNISPNPSHSQTTLTYQFSQPTDVTLYIENVVGQVMQRQILRGITVGSVDISTSEWASGTYILSMQYGKEIKTKKFEVQH